MHLIALALAYLKDAVTPDLGELLTRGSLHAVMEFIPTSYPQRVERVPGRNFPLSVLEPENYRRLAILLADNNASSLLHNADYVSDVL
jgi:hypothetical protein